MTVWKHKRLVEAPVIVGSTRFHCDAQGILHPQPEGDALARVKASANYCTVAVPDPEPAPAPEAEPAPAAETATDAITNNSAEAAPAAPPAAAPAAPSGERRNPLGTPSRKKK